MRTGRRCADSHGGGKTETAKEDDAHEAVTFMAPYMEVGAFIEQVHSVYPEVNVEIVPYSGDNTTTCLQNMFTAGDLPDVCTLTVYVSSSLTVDDSRMSYLHGSSFAEAKERLDRIIRQQAGQRRQTFTVNTLCSTKTCWPTPPPESGADEYPLQRSQVYAHRRAYPV